MKPFRERNPVPIGLTAIVLMAMFAVLAFKAQDFPLFNGGGSIYKANFSEIANLRKDNEVRIAGVKVGKVTSTSLENDHVLVKFRVAKGTQLGRLTSASIRIKTLVGAEFLALDPEGEGKLNPSTAIPVTRTDPPFDVIPAFQDLATTVGGIDKPQLTKALDTLSDAFSSTPPNVKGALTGLSRLSRTVASRDDALRQLLQHARGVTDVLAARDTTLQQLLVDADKVVQVLQQRKETISALLRNTVSLSQQLSGLVADNRAALAPTLRSLQGVIQTLNDNAASISRTIQVLGPFVRVFSNTIGNGHWFDTVVSNLGPILPVGGLLPTGVTDVGGVLKSDPTKIGAGGAGGTGSTGGVPGGLLP